MKLETKILIKNLNDRLLIQNIILQTLIDVILDNGFITEDDLNSQIKSKIELLNIEFQSQDKSNDLDDFMGFHYTGPMGEA